MKVKELIAKLQEMNPEANLIRNGHSDSDAYVDIHGVEEMEVIRYKSDWSGSIRNPIAKHDDMSQVEKVVHIG